MAIAAAGVLAVAGLAVDIGRVFIAKNEIQVACDAAALAAAGQLDGTINGLSRAQDAVSAMPNKWNFGSEREFVNGCQFTRLSLSRKLR
jgi:uncharacterized membrane protein